MRLTFTKGPAKYDWLDVVRKDGSAAARIDCPKQGIIPHDMVHYAVERALGRRGFIARVAGGEAASFRMAAEAESDGVERLVEVFQADGWSGGNSAPDEILALYRVTCRARGCLPLDIGADDVEAVRETIRALTLRWEAVPVGGSLALAF